MADSQQSSGESGRLLSAAGQYAAKKVADANAKAVQQRKAAHALAQAAVDKAHSRAKLIAGSVQAYYFPQRLGIAQWNPTDGGGPSVKRHDRTQPSDLVFDQSSSLLYSAVAEDGYIMTVAAEDWYIMMPMAGEDRHIRTMAANNRGRNVLYRTPAPQSIALDAKNGALYWISDFQWILEGSLDGKQQPVQRIKIPNRADHLMYMKMALVETSDGPPVFYWADGRAIYRATSSTDVKAIVPPRDGSQPTYLVLDAARETIYWIDDRRQKIRRSDLGGAGVADVCDARPMYAIRGMCVDGATGDLYFLDGSLSSAAVIRRLDNRTSQVEDVLELDEDYLGWGLALRLKEANQRVRDAIAAKHANAIKARKQIARAQAKAQSSVAAKNREKAKKLKEKHDTISAKQEWANGQKAQAQAKLNAAKAKAARDTANANRKKQAAVAKARETARTLVNKAHAAAGKSVKKAQAKLNAARSRKRKKMK